MGIIKCKGYFNIIMPWIVGIAKSQFLQSMEITDMLKIDERMNIQWVTDQILKSTCCIFKSCIIGMYIILCLF